MAHQVNAAKYAVKDNAIKREAKVNVKEIRKKFESTTNGSLTARRPSNSMYLSSHLLRNKDDLRSNEIPSKTYLKLKPLEKPEDNNLSAFCDSHVKSSHKDITPRAPVRRNRKNINNSKTEENRSLKYNISSDINRNIVLKSSNKVSDREQLFPAVDHIELNNKFRALNIDLDKNVSFAKSNSPQPPIKPPRTPNKTKIASDSFQFSELHNPLTIKDANLVALAELDMYQNGELGEMLQPDNTLRSSRNSIRRKPALRLSPRFSVPEIYFNDIKMDQTPKTDLLTHKQQKSSIYASKKKILKDYFKNLNAVAHNIHAMVRGKQNDFLSDFRFKPTAQSQKYGTLKKCFSEEHIYAEPLQPIPAISHNNKLCSNTDALHYMCTPILSSKFDRGNQVIGNDITALNQTQGNMKQSKASFQSPILSSKFDRGNQVIGNDITPLNQVQGNMKQSKASCAPVLSSKLDRGNQAIGNDFAVLNQTQGNVKHSKASLRKIIYESFSMLRKIPEDDENVKESQSGDSESDVSVKDVEERITYVKSIKRHVSTSSICIAPKLFDAVLILTISESGPEVLFKQSKAQAPYDYPLIQHLCFPDYKTIKKRDVYTSEWFYFTLIHGEDEKIYGYCHRILGWSEEKRGFARKLPVAICIVSSINAPLFYKKISEEIEKHLVLPTNKCVEYLATLQKLGVPNAGASLCITEDKKEAVISRPFDSHTVGGELTRSLQLLDVDVLLKTVASLLLERRVLLLSRNAEDLLCTVTAVASLLYPFQWQHLLMPIVPTCLAVQCCIESPYLLGIVSTNHNDILDLLGEQNVFVVDVGKGSILKCFGDEDTILPKKVQKAVICALNLAKNMTDPTETMRDIMISEAIVHMFVEILGHYHNHFSLQKGTFVFQKEAFQKAGSSRNIQSFLKWFSETQMFEAFIEECIWRKTYRDICQSQLTTFFEKRIEEYNWELTYNNAKITKKIVKRVQDFGEKLKGLKRT